MATNKSGRTGRTQSRGKSNKSKARKQRSSGWMASAKGNPLTAAIGAAAAVGAGMFLWSRRNQISDQISDLSDQLSDSGEGDERTQAEIAEEALTLKEIGEAS